MPPYTSNIPQANDRMSDSQLPILNNFIEINTFNSVNHVALNAAGQGKHKFVSMPEQGAAPGVAANEVALFSQDSAYNVGTTVLAYQNEAATVYELGAGGSNWAVLPCGLLMKWGSHTANLAGQKQTYIIPFGAANGPSFTSIASAQLNVYSNFDGDYDQFVRYHSFATGTQTLTFYVSKRTTTAMQTTNAAQFYYMILGR